MLVPLIRSDTKILSLDIPSTNQLHQELGVPLHRCSLAIVLKEAYIPQEDSGHWCNRERAQIPLPLPHLPISYNIVKVNPLLLLLLLLSLLTSLHD